MLFSPTKLNMESADELELSDYSETNEEGILIGFFSLKFFYLHGKHWIESFFFAEVQEAPVVSATEEKKPKPTYSPKELNELVSYLQKMVFLDGIDESDWNEQCDDVIRTWFLDTNQPILIVYYSAKQVLTASLMYPSEPVLEIVYFLREPNHIFTLDNFHDDVTFGQINDDVDGTFLLLMEKLYTPMFFHKTDWSDSNRAEFLTSIHTFLSHMTELHYKLVGLTVLYVPSEGLVDDAEKAIEDKQLVKRLEAIAQHWVEQLRACLRDSEQVVSYELMCPADEYEFWIYRCESLQIMFAN